MKKKKKTEIVIMLKGEVIKPPAKYLYRGKHRNPYLPDDSAHFWGNGYAMWRPPRESKVFIT